MSVYQMGQDEVRFYRRFYRYCRKNHPEIMKAYKEDFKKRYIVKYYCGECWHYCFCINTFADRPIKQRNKHIEESRFLHRLRRVK